MGAASGWCAPRLLSAHVLIKSIFAIRTIDDRYASACPSVAESDLDLRERARDLGELQGPAELARDLGFGVTGNFIIDPDFSEDDFRGLWDFMDANQLYRVGFTILTPLPGTAYFAGLSPRLVGQPWFKYDMHHLLWEPRLGAKRFFELYAETWRRSVLNTSGEKRWRDWMRQVRPAQVPYLTRVLWRTQRMMRAEAYVREHECLAGTGRGAARSVAARS
mgnify:CR=1 FL=1